MNAQKSWSDPELAFEIWKEYAGIGGRDKDRMIQIVTWLLAFSAGIIGLYATGELKQAQRALLLLGVVVSFLAAVTALLYGGYAARNWAIADEIAKKYHQAEMLPDYDPFTRSEVPWSAYLPIYWLGRPCKNRIAPVFWLFFWGSIISLAVLFMRTAQGGWRMWPNGLRLRRIRLLKPILSTCRAGHTRHDRRYDSAVLVSSRPGQEAHRRV